MAPTCGGSGGGGSDTRRLRPSPISVAGSTPWHKGGAVAPVLCSVRALILYSWRIAVAGRLGHRCYGQIFIREHAAARFLYGNGKAGGHVPRCGSLTTSNNFPCHSTMFHLCPYLLLISGSLVMQRSTRETIRPLSSSEIAKTKRFVVILLNM
jgi:hypothetical protein